MNIRRTILAVLAAALLLTSCVSIDNSSSEPLGIDARELSPADMVSGSDSQTAVPSSGSIVIRDSVTSITEDGIARTNVNADEAIAEGYDYGDILSITAGSVKFSAPIVSAADEVEDGQYFIIFDENGASIGRRNASTGLSVGDRITFSMEEKEGFLRTHILHSLRASGARLTDLTHYEAGSMKSGHLFTVYAPLFVSADADNASALLEKYGISAVIDLSEGLVDVTGITAPEGLEYRSTSDMAEAMRYIISFDKPYLIVLGDNTVSYRIVPILEALMGGRLDQIISDCLQPYQEYYGLSADSREYQELSDMITDFFTGLNEGTVPRDKSLLTLAVNYLRNEVGLSVDEVSSVRLSLR